MLRLDTSWEDSVCDAVSAMKGSSAEFRAIQRLFREPSADPSGLGQQVCEYLSLPPDDFEGYSRARAAEMGHDAWRVAGRALLEVLREARVELPELVVAVLELRLRHVRCAACGHEEDEIDVPRADPSNDLCPECWQPR